MKGKRKSVKKGVNTPNTKKSKTNSKKMNQKQRDLYIRTKRKSKEESTQESTQQWT